MSYLVIIRSFEVGARVAGMLIALALPAYAQIDQPAAPEPPAKSQQSLATDPAPPSQTATIEAFISRLDIGTRAIHENRKDPELVREGCRALLNEVLDLKVMARATNTEIWDLMDDSQRETLLAAFAHRMISNCVRQFAQYEGENMRLAGVKSTPNGDMLATVRLGTRDDAKLVTWRLHNSGSTNLRAVDVITEGRSAVSDARNEFAAVLQSVNGDIEALIAFMQK